MISAKQDSGGRRLETAPWTVAKSAPRPEKLDGRSKEFERKLFGLELFP